MYWVLIGNTCKRIIGRNVITFEAGAAGIETRNRSPKEHITNHMTFWD